MRATNDEFMNTLYEIKLREWIILGEKNEGKISLKNFAEKQRKTIEELFHESEKKEIGKGMHKFTAYKTNNPSRKISPTATPYIGYDCKGCGPQIPISPKIKRDNFENTGVKAIDYSCVKCDTPLARLEIVHGF